MISGLALKICRPSYSGRPLRRRPAASTSQSLGEAVAVAGGEVVGAVRGRGVDGAGALVGRDVVGEDAEDLAVEKGVLEGDAVELGAFEACDLLCASGRLQACLVASARASATM